MLKSAMMLFRAPNWTRDLLGLTMTSAASLIIREMIRCHPRSFGRLLRTFFVLIACLLFKPTILSDSVLPSNDGHRSNAVEDKLPILLLGADIDVKSADRQMIENAENPEGLLNSMSVVLGLEYRRVQDATLGTAPFTMLHTITRTPEAPWSGPHIAFRLPVGNDTGKYCYGSETLNADELGVAELAMSWD
ncbi:hypothetical protein ACN47E_006040 [Coniothyrium glycines]